MNQNKTCNKDDMQKYDLHLIERTTNTTLENWKTT